MLRFDDERSGVVATIVHYACHPTIVGWTNRMFCPDFPGVVRRVVEEQAGGTCLFLQGAAGGIGFVSLFLAGSLLSSTGFPNDDPTPEQMLEYLSQHNGSIEFGALVLIPASGLALLVFLLGTAIEAPQLLSVRVGAVLGIFDDREGPQGVPTGIAELAPAVAGSFVPVCAARRAQTLAVRGADRHGRQFGHHQVAQRLLEVDLVVADTVYEVPTHVQRYEELKDQVVAFGHSTGSPHTVAINSQLQADGILAIPLTWYSGWSDPALNANLLHHGINYCMEAHNILGYLTETMGDAISETLAKFPRERTWLLPVLREHLEMARSIQQALGGKGMKY